MSMLSGVLAGLGEGETRYAAMFAKGKAIWSDLLSTVDWTAPDVMPYLTRKISTSQREFEEISGADRDLGLTVMIWTFPLPFYDETLGYNDEDRVRLKMICQAMDNAGVSGLLTSELNHVARIMMFELQD
ncbi:hypothetical protein [Herbaspirillum rubrisubalbicans]|uniref:hypothetical protein n=1 Tax=Herbaspirillum rubrisubalbicans TaxID=80842 RepID=UPI0015C545F6|nr:hypothetical protein [Herbaspirillum rubrisubalbicans]